MLQVARIQVATSSISPSEKCCRICLQVLPGSTDHCSAPHSTLLGSIVTQMSAVAAHTYRVFHDKYTVQTRPVDQFGHDGRTRDKLATQCNHCLALSAQQRAEQAMKACITCGLTFPRSRFSQLKSPRDGLGAQCKNCARVMLAKMPRCALNACIQRWPPISRPLHRSHAEHH
jgi:hypothetical protein